MKLEEYVEVMLPMIRVIYQEKERNPKGYKKRQLWYLYRQYFYGFAEFIDRKTLMNASQHAQKAFERLRPGHQLVQEDWKTQPTFDKGRKVFNLDHIYTGTMFRSAVDRLASSNLLTVEAIRSTIQDNYRMAWILKFEEKKLPKSKRGETLKDALEIYNERGIMLAQ